MKRKIKTGLLLIKKHKIALILFSIILLGAYLRLNDFSNLARFNADQVRDAKVVDAMLDGEFPLLGPKAGGTTFNLGPAFYYLEYTSGLIFGNNPAGIALFVPILSTASILLFFILLRFYFTANISLVLTFLYAASFYAIRYTRFAWNPNAIPFFLFAFLIALLKIMEKGDKKYNWHIVLGISAGIAMQLHTTLLILMPILLLSVYSYILFKKKWKVLPQFFAMVAVILFLNAPFFIHDIKNDGENIGSFFQGTTTKTQENSSFIENITLDGQFFVQGGAYALSGIEPQKSWLRINKLITSGNLSEIILFLFGTALFFTGFFLLILKLKSKNNLKEREFLGLILLTSALPFVLFLPIANELNLRFFIILIFLPFILFGLISEFAFKKIKSDKLCWLVVFSAVLLISLSNVNAYRSTYDLENYTAPESAYGGISLGEAKSISSFMQEIADKNMDNELFMLPFEFEKSIDYLNSKKGVAVGTFSPNKLANQPIVFSIVDKKIKDESLTKAIDQFDLLQESTYGRFTIFALKPKNLTYKIGFITDIHGELKNKSNNDLDVFTKNTLDFFVSKMNNDFKPDLTIQNGDFIEGTGRRGEQSIQDFSFLLNHFDQLNSPFYNVLGNHDLRGLSAQEWMNFTNSDNIYYSFKNENLSVITLSGNDSETMDSSLYEISKAQFKWLEENLANDDNLRKIVFVHYPIVTKNIEPGDRTLPAETREKLKKLFSKYGVMAVFSGHIEKLEMNEENGVRYFVIPGIKRSNNKTVQWYDSFAEITIEDDVAVDFYYKKDRSQRAYQMLAMPSTDFDEIVK